MRKTLTTVALLLALSCPVFAGEMHTPAVAPPPPSASAEPTTEGQIDVPPLVQIALSLLALF